MSFYNNVLIAIVTVILVVLLSAVVDRYHIIVAVSVERLYILQLYGSIFAYIDMQLYGSIFAYIDM